VLRDFVNDRCDRVLVDSRETFQRMQAFANDYTLSFAERIQHYSGDRPLFDLYASKTRSSGRWPVACRSSPAAISSSTRPRR